MIIEVKVWLESMSVTLPPVPVDSRLIYHFESPVGPNGPVPVFGVGGG